MKTYRVHIPSKYNTNQPIEADKIKGIEDAFLVICGGFSSDAATVGYWKNCAGKLFIDYNNVYIVSVPEGKEDLFFNILRNAKHNLKQEAIYVVEIGNAIFI